MSFETLKNFKLWFFAVLFLLLASPTMGFAQKLDVKTLVIEQPLIWTDESAIVQLPSDETVGEKTFSIQMLTRAGLGIEKKTHAAVDNGHLSITPQGEGIHIIRLQSGEKTLETRFLAIQPPALLDATQKAALRSNLPYAGAKLFRGEPVTILAMGDSVTATGDYPAMFAKFLARTTGNQHIQVIKKAYSGRSIDATVRHWPDDVRDIKPDLGLLMYGLNDQVTFYPLDAYLEQYRWVAAQMKMQFGADTVFMQPTTHIDIPLDEASRKPDSNPPHYIFRTIGFAESLRPLAAELKVPLAETFSAVWGEGGPTLVEAARRLQPLYPPSYSKQFNTLLESGGNGDTIHLNALGHLAMARSLFEAVTGQKKSSPMQFTAQSRWSTTGVRSKVTIRNSSQTRRVGHIEVYPLLRGDVQGGPLNYDLAPQQTTSFEVSWPQAKEPNDLLKFPNDHYLAQGRPLVPLVDVVGDSSQVYAIPAPFEVNVTLERERQISKAGKPVKVSLLRNGKKQELTLKLPDTSVGSIPVVQKVEQNGKTGWVTGEVRFTRFGAARDGDAQIDGDLKEWQGQPFVPVGEPSQARYSSGPQDFRATPHEAYLNWAFKAGKDGIFLAAKGEGQLQKDNFTLFFDPRSPSELGRVGRYYWVAGKLQPDGKIQLNKGETSPDAPAMTGIWRQTTVGLNLEVFIPYALFEQKSWPLAGDLGLSIWWVHTGANEQRTNLMWSEEGHPWNTRWYGVVRRSQNAAQDKQLPFMVRVK